MGGNGTVWKVKVDGDVSFYATKILNPEKIKDSEKLERFVNECQFCKDTDHKHIIRVIDYFIEKEKAYCIMPYYSKNLRTVINTENDPFVLLKYIIQLCEAIKYIHNKKITHRDLKLENILISDDDTLVLTDFGIAHFEDSIVTKKREWLGNRRYAALEQLATDEVTTACDIYALGRIINELYTKQNPLGESFLQISDINPLFSPLDHIVQRCRIQNPKLRPNIKDILAELYLFEGEAKDEINEIKEIIVPIEETGYTEEKEDVIIAQAAKDIILAKHIFENFSDAMLESINTQYHSNILYSASEILQNLLFQTNVLFSCKKKFHYESQAYSSEQVYFPLNLEDENEKNLYKELEEILGSCKIPYDFSYITTYIKKYFCSCCDYHCEELLRDIKYLYKNKSDISQVPILHIVYVLRKYLNKDELKKIVFSDNISISWELYPSIELSKKDVYLVSLDERELEILKVFKEKYDVCYFKSNFNHYYVMFNSLEEFRKFKNYALKLSKPYYIFEGDVKELVQIKRKYNNIVEIEPLNSFDIINTLAKILGLRTDY